MTWHCSKHAREISSSTYGTRAMKRARAREFLTQNVTILSLRPHLVSSSLLPLFQYRWKFGNVASVVGEIKSMELLHPSMSLPFFCWLDGTIALSSCGTRNSEVLKHPFLLSTEQFLMCHNSEIM
jgi:hypothetical protein